MDLKQAVINILAEIESKGAPVDHKGELQALQGQKFLRVLLDPQVVTDLRHALQGHIAATAEPPRVLIAVEGGVVQEIISDAPVRAFLCDWDWTDCEEPPDDGPIGEYAVTGSSPEAYQQALDLAAVRFKDELAKLDEQKAGGQ